jgi:hypothetical protein
VEEPRVAVSAPGRRTASKPLGDLVDVVAWRESEESREAFDPWQRAAGLGLLETAREWLAGARAER